MIHFYKRLQIRWETTAPGAPEASCGGGVFGCTVTGTVQGHSLTPGPLVEVNLAIKQAVIHRDKSSTKL